VRGALEENVRGFLIDERGGADFGDVIVGAALRVEPAHDGLAEEVEDRFPRRVFGLFAGPDADGADRAVRRRVARFDELVGVESAGGGGKTGRCVDEEDDDFAFGVNAGVIVVVPLGRRDAVAGENHCGFDRGVFVRGIAQHQIIFFEDEFEFARIVMDDEGVAIGLRRELAEADVLEIGGVVAGRLEAHLLELGADIIGGEHGPFPPRRMNSRSGGVTHTGTPGKSGRQLTWSQCAWVRRMARSDFGS
jgi:hypothetical protein